MGIRFSRRELDVMAVLWKYGPSTAGEVREHLGTSLAYNTVLTVLRVMEAKGYATHTVDGKSHRYHALIDRHTAGDTAIARLLETVFGGSAEQLMLYLVRGERLDVKAIDRLRAVLDERAGISRAARNHQRVSGGK